jgi:hypothetical protein
MVDDLRNEVLIVFPRVLFVQDAVLLLFESRAAEEVPAVEAVHSVETVLAVPDERTEENPVIILVVAAEVLQLAVIEEVAVSAIPASFPAAAERAILTVLENEALVTIFRVPELVAGDVLALDLVGEPVGDRCLQSSDFRSDPFRISTQGPHLLLIFFRGAQFVEEVILLIPQIDAPEAVVATGAVFAVNEVSGIETLFAVQAIVERAGLQTFVAPFAFQEVVAIADVFAVEDPIAVIAVLRPEAADEEV